MILHRNQCDLKSDLFYAPWNVILNLCVIPDKCRFIAILSSNYFTKFNPMALYKLSFFLIKVELKKKKRKKSKSVFLNVNQCTF